MVKVISVGALQITCNKCKSVLEYTHSDIKEYHDYDYGGGHDIYRGFNCPICNTLLTPK
jgi:hypothetical protein